MASAAKARLRRLALVLGRVGRRFRWRVYRALGGPGPMEIVAYRGYGTQDRLHVKGRVLVDKRLRLATRDDRFWRNLRNMRKRILSRPIPHARLKVRFQARELEVSTDEFGFFETWIRTSAPLPSDRVWHEVDLELVSPLREDQGPVRTTAEVRVPGARTRFVVVSDIDDTVVLTGATNVISLIRESFTGNAYSRTPFPGVSAFYRALRDGAGGAEENPLLFVSRSPWNLYDILCQSFDIHGISERPILFLRKWGLSEEGLTVAQIEGLKFRQVTQMISLFRDLPFILIGDSGQKDPEIYREVIRRHPGRVLAVYIRNVSRNVERPEAIRALAEEVSAQGSSLILAEDSLAMARHAAAAGWIDPAALAGIDVERVRERAEAGEAPGPEAPVLTAGPGSEAGSPGETRSERSPPAGPPGDGA